MGVEGARSPVLAGGDPALAALLAAAAVGSTATATPQRGATAVVDGAGGVATEQRVRGRGPSQSAAHGRGCGPKASSGKGQRSNPTTMIATPRQIAVSTSHRNHFGSADLAIDSNPSPP